MKIEITFTMDEEDYGKDMITTATSEGIDDLYDVSNFLTVAMNGAGFSYVTNVGFEKDDGTVVFGDS